MAQIVAQGSRHRDFFEGIDLIVAQLQSLSFHLGINVASRPRHGFGPYSFTACGGHDLINLARVRPFGHIAIVGAFIIKTLAQGIGISRAARQ